MAKNTAQFKNLPDQHLFAIYQYITGLENMTDTELSKPILRPGLQDTYLLFLIQYALLSLIGILTNVWIIYYIARHKLYRENTHAFFINLSICHFVQSAFVVPITLVIIVVHNWILGQFMCYFVPMLQVSKWFDNFIISQNVLIVDTVSNWSIRAREASINTSHCWYDTFCVPEWNMYNA